MPVSIKAFLLFGSLACAYIAAWSCWEDVRAIWSKPSEPLDLPMLAIRLAVITAAVWFGSIVIGWL